MIHTSTKPRRCLATVATGVWLLSAATALPAQPPDEPAVPDAQAAPDKWTITLRYGGGTPSDAGPMGHCTATFRSDGHVKIESRRRQGDAGLKNVVLYENDALAPETLQAIARAADEALKEPSKSRRTPEDGSFFYLSRAGTTNSHVRHYNLLELWHAPPAMLKFVKLLNDLLPPKERVPLAPEPDDQQPPAKADSLKKEP